MSNSGRGMCRHHVPHCTMCGLSPCAAVKTISWLGVAALRNASSEFDCSMVPGHAGPAGTAWVFDMGARCFQGLDAAVWTEGFCLCDACQHVARVRGQRKTQNQAKIWLGSRY